MAQWLSKAVGKLSAVDADAWTEDEKNTFNQTLLNLQETIQALLNPSEEDNACKCLQMTADWYKIFYVGSSDESTYKFCTQQIAEYVESARKRNLIWATGGIDFKSVPLIGGTQGPEQARKEVLK